MAKKFLKTLMLFCLMQNSLQLEHLLTIMEEFNFNHPYLIGSFNDITLESIKVLSKDGHYLNVQPKVNEFSFNEKVTSNAIIFVNSTWNFHFDSPKIIHHSLMLITKDNIFEDILNTVAAQSSIDQKVFIFEADSLEMYEAYTINNVVLKKKLGHVDCISGNFKWQKNVNPDFIKRRSDFQGVILKGIVGFWASEMNADSSYLEKAPYFSKNETYQINGFTFGLYNDILMHLQSKLNFTTVLYKRKKDVWGFVDFVNGSYIGKGMVADIFNKTADIAVTPMFIKINRARFIDYLPPIKPDVCGIYVANSDQERISFKTYLAPFTLLLWATLTFIGVAIALIRFLLLKVHGNGSIFGFDHIWSSFSGFMGGKPTPTPIDKKSSYKTMIMATLLCGTITWIAYRGHLNSELAVFRKNYPFNDMESFSKTNWRYLFHTSINLNNTCMHNKITTL